jgi:hypothetical protein
MSSDAPPPRRTGRPFPFPAELSGLAATDAVKAARRRPHKSAPQWRGRANGRRHSGDSGLTSPLCGTREELGAAKVACKALSNDPDTAKATLAEAECAASEATEPVMLEQAERDATFLVAARREVWRLEAQLRALGETWTSRREGPRAVRLSRTVFDALSAVEPQYPSFQRPKVKQAAAWRAFHAALLTDPDATWEE